MKKTLVLVTALALTATPSLAIDVHIDYDRMARFTTFKTFAWFDSPETSLRDTSDLTHERIKKTILDVFSSGRLKLVTEDPDLLVTYHTSSREDFRVNTASFGYGYPGNWYWDPYWGGSFSTTTVSTYTRGTLIIDVWDAKEKTLVWRGSASAVVSNNPEKNQKKVEKAVTKIAKKWQKIKPGF
jgi:hypothetical protein